MTIGGTTESFSEGKALSQDLRASEPEQMAALVQELERISKTAKDYVVPSPEFGLRVVPGADGGSHMAGVFPVPELALTAKAMYGVRRVAHEQLSEKLQIPLAYYRRMQSEAPTLLCENTNHWLREKGQNLLLRTLDGDVRAVLSDRFRALDNYDLFFHVGQVAREAGAVVQRLDLSEERFYMRLLQPGFAAKITGRGEDLATKGKMFSTGYRRDDGTWQRRIGQLSEVRGQLAFYDAPLRRMHRSAKDSPGCSTTTRCCARRSTT